MASGVAYRVLSWFPLAAILSLGLWIVARVLRPRRLRARVADDIIVAMAQVRANRRRLRHRTGAQRVRDLSLGRRRGIAARRRS
jgi:hypothetical protein